MNRPVPVSKKKFNCCAAVELLSREVVEVVEFVLRRLLSAE
jgi:hypothetical protein